MNNNGVLLIFDMDENSARLSKDTLNQLCSNDIIIAETISNATNTVENNEVVFIILNFLYNNDECLEFIKKIRSSTNNNNYKMPILAFIEGNTPITEKEVLDAGASKCVSKPFDHNKLKDSILDIINNPKNFIMADNYIGPDRRNQDINVKNDKRNNR